MNYNEVINELIKNNPVTQINLLYYDPGTSLKINWQNKKEFLSQLKTWTTSFPAKKGDLISLKTENVQKFRLKKLLKQGKVLGLHSRLTDRRGRVHYWLMLDLNAKPTPYNLRKITLYLGSLLYLLKIKTGGYILETDRSYHFLGKKFVNAKTYKLFLNNVIKSNGGNGLADVGFCGHTLAKNLDVCLRIQKRKEGKGLKVVAEI